MNPFDLYGPEFLVFYVVFAGAVVMLLYLANKLGAPADVPSLPLEDPYLLACLRGGRREAITAATISLIDRGLLQVNSDVISKRDDVEITSVRLPLEQRLVRYLKPGKQFRKLFNEGILEGANSYQEALERLGLLPDSSARFAGRLRVGIALALLIGVSATKIWIAISRGRTNFMFLLLLTGVASYVGWKVGMPARTAAGNRALKGVQSLFENLRDRSQSVRPGGATKELVWLAALFGMSAISETSFPHIGNLRRSLQQSGASSSGGCGSSGCGGGCGGGGCGGCGS
jgi:uncharacterized protein (TIGR04222 family)